MAVWKIPRETSHIVTFGNLCSYLERLVQDYASQGWEFYRVDTITVVIAPGCLGILFGERAQSRHYYIVTFRAPN